MLKTKGSLLKKLLRYFFNLKSIILFKAMLKFKYYFYVYLIRKYFNDDSFFDFLIIDSYV